ncbi:efflux RND transporter periplasmic adaptor subunit [Sneathiella sp. P13V-1]|uniref:efflux RND transporter periplasmic adaptor subunit n=1 Tax=Sneathiella sp. P13V-1 TaxID=2697366 RepID=UPI00187BC1EF|nr:efflux RND transporter periplasmic adaptor subunit [Sneathiella sp. P13V-1]MBE7637074.1 efflux RND transporter periplasmic adaptor subunit [Sneathiella sp. P13V-1]
MLKVCVRYVLAACLPLALAACGEEKVETTEVIRSIKPFYVSELSGGIDRTFSGAIKASGVSNLSFSVSGTIKEILVKQGDKVKKNQTIAKLDATPFEYEVNAARARQQAADAALKKASADLDRQKSLYEKGWVAKAAFDQAVLSIDSAKSDLRYANSHLQTAERNLAKTELKAPYDGVIAEKKADEFTEVTAGSSVVVINSTDVLEVEILVPDRAAPSLQLGQPVNVDAAGNADCGCTGRITEIGAVADAANSVVVTAALDGKPERVIPGTAVDVSILFRNDDGVDGYLVPLNAIVPGDNSGAGYVFKFDESSKQVRKTKVEGRAGEGNMVSITSGVGAGDILAAAGVSFLRDGQEVKLMSLDQ